ncbi:hypothetical protein C8J57DRAFT_1528788 [Mycena rebaudengoi]|nr:hypothetical protein C8J57DRAFT_1528788 [Mycena rebaudengoi]
METSLTPEGILTPEARAAQNIVIPNTNNDTTPTQEAREAREARDTKDAAQNIITAKEFRFDLLKNRDPTARLTVFDGYASALVQESKTKEWFFITTFANYIPHLPRWSDILRRKDMRYGTDDPAQWPQKFSSKFPHLAAMPCRREVGELGIMWWNPDPKDWRQVADGAKHARGVGRLCTDRFDALAYCVNTLIEECNAYNATISAPNRLFAVLENTLRLGLERLQILPVPYKQMANDITCLQRAYLELKGLLKYLSVYQQRMNDPKEQGTRSPDECMGAFVFDPLVAQSFRKANLPYWLVRPLRDFEKTNIQTVHDVVDPQTRLELAPDSGATLVAGGGTTDSRIKAINRLTWASSWYHDPFTSPSGVTAPPASPPASSQPGPSHHGNERRDSRYQPYRAPVTKKAPVKVLASKLLEKGGRNKFVALERTEMPSSIPAWSNALLRVMSVGDITPGSASNKLYVYPEPALLAAPEDPVRRQLILHHFRLLHDPLLHGLIGGQLPLISSNEWREILAGHLYVVDIPVMKHGKDKKVKENRSKITPQRKEVLQPIFTSAMTACDVAAGRDYPAAVNNHPSIDVQQAKELIWEAAETNFRFELLALDARASQLSRAEECRKCFQGGVLMGMSIDGSKVGFTAPTVAERHPYIVRLARLMCQWNTTPRPVIITTVDMRPQWPEEDQDRLEVAVAEYYTQSFWDLFGRAAVVPMRLEHDLGTQFPPSYKRAAGLQSFGASLRNEVKARLLRSMTVQTFQWTISKHARLIPTIQCSMIQTSIHPATAALARRIKSAYSKDHLLAFGAPVTVVIWMFDECKPAQIILYPREDGRVRLADNAEAINAQDGWDDYDTGYFELWMVNKWGVGTWEKAKWNTPLKVPTGNTLLIRDLGVTEMHDFDTYEHHMCQI